MSLVLKDRVKETTNTAGTGAVTLLGASAGFQSFAAVGDGNETYYVITDIATGDWEVGIGTYTASGTTLSRTTVLSSSNAGSLVSFGAGQKDVFVSYPSSRAVYQDTAGFATVQNEFNTLNAGTANITSANITGGTVATAPTNGNDLVNKTYVDTVAASGLHYHMPVYVEVPDTTGNLNATYNNGASGVGATLTNAGTQTAFVADGVAVPLNARVLVYNQTNAYENGVYTLTAVGSNSTNWVLTRASDADTYSPYSPNSLGQGDAFFVTNGNTGAGETYVCNTVGAITFGATAITFVQISDATLYTAGTGLTLFGTQFSITDTGVAANTYGAAATVPVITVNAQGQVTSVVDTPIAISGSAVSGNIAGQAGSVANALTAGSYLTAAGTYDGSAARTFSVNANSSNTASTVVARDSSGNFSAGTITATLSGSATSAGSATNIAGGAANQLVYQSGSGTTAFATAPSASNQVVSWNGSAFTWVAGTISGVPLGSNLNMLTLGTSGTGLSGSATYDGSGVTTFTVTSNATSANTPSAIVARDAAGNFSAGTITATLSGSATSAGSVSNAVTFDNGGTGGSSGSTFNGSTPLTVSYNTVGAPSTTGTNASGTWGINISGNAATATGLSSTLGVSGGGTGLTSLTAGYIPFGNGTSPFGSSANLFWDSTNSRLGLGGNNPQARLDLYGNQRLMPQITQQNTVVSVTPVPNVVNLQAYAYDPGGWDWWYVYPNGPYINVDVHFPAPLSGSSYSALSQASVGTSITLMAAGSIYITGTVEAVQPLYGSYVTLSLSGVFGSYGYYFTYYASSPTEYISPTILQTEIVADSASTGWISGYTHIAIGGSIVPVSAITVSGDTLTYAGALSGLTAGNVIGTFATDTVRSITAVADDGTTSGVSFNPSTTVKRWSVGGLSVSGAQSSVLLGENVASTYSSGSGNIFVGDNIATALTSSDYPSSNIVLGGGAGYDLRGGSSNVVIGGAAGYWLKNSSENVFIGVNAGAGFLGGNITGNTNVYIGRLAGRDISSASQNTAVGPQAGRDITSGSNNTLLGAYTGNQNNLDIRTLNNYVVLSDGNGTRRLTVNNAGAWAFNNTTPDYGTAGQVMQSNGSGSAPSWTTISSPNNGTLTLNVSGTGLSGSATFTANQSGNSTFTVTSNATSSNTGSTIVARDASGNFSAGTITAALSGNASTATTATTASNLGGGSAGTIPYQSAANTTVQLAAGTSGQVLRSNGAAAPSWVNGTISGISLGSNLNTLTLSTSGTGLSGSTTYNGSGAATFTVTSNATSANIASAIVARDSNGDFNAGALNLTRGLTSDPSGSQALRVVSPGGASFYTSFATGALQIQLPTALGTGQTMLRMRISVWTYDGQSFDIYAGAYLYNLGVVNNFAYMLTGSRPALNTRWGWDGSRWSFFIGDIGTSWQYPVVSVTDVQLGYSSYTTPGTWTAGWNVQANNSSYGTVYAGPTSISPQQQQLVSGTSIKTINGNSLLGSGNLSISASPAGSNTQIQYNSSGAFGASSNLGFDAAQIGVMIGTTLNGGYFGNSTWGYARNNVEYDSSITAPNSMDRAGLFISNSNQTNRNLSSIVFGTRNGGGGNPIGQAAIYGINRDNSSPADPRGGLGIAVAQSGLVEVARFTYNGYFKSSNAGAFDNINGQYNEFVVNGVNGNWNTVFKNTQSNAALPLGIFAWYSAASPNNTAAQFFRAQDSSATRMEVRSNGGIANFQANNVNLSDRREKTNFAPAKSYLETICAIPVQTFNYVDQNMEDDPGLTLGVVAQDVEAVAPELVHESNWGTEENPKMRLSIYQTDLQYALMKCVQELKAELDTVKAELNTLKGI